MKPLTIFFALILTGLTVSAQTAAEPMPPITMRYGEQIELNADSIGIAFLNYAVGLISKGATIALVKGDSASNVIAIIGNTSGDSPIGLFVSADGQTLTINSNVVVISRKTFNSHGQADVALQTGEEYYLAGDRLVYRKP